MRKYRRPAVWTATPVAADVSSQNTAALLVPVLTSELWVVRPAQPPAVWDSTPTRPMEFAPVVQSAVMPVPRVRSAPDAPLWLECSIISKAGPARLSARAGLALSMAVICQFARPAEVTALLARGQPPTV